MLILVSKSTCGDASILFYAWKWRSTSRPKSAGTVVDNCIRHADIVLFSAALPGQQGRRHVNEQLPEYWVALFRSRGFVVFDVIRPLIWDDGNIPIWYRQNTLLFVREDLQVAATLQMEAERVAAAMPLNRAHPDLLKWFSHEATLAKQASADATKANHDLQRRLADTTARLTAASRRAEGELQRANSALAVLRQEREIIFNSTIWRMTGPLRSAGRTVPVPVPESAAPGTAVNGCTPPNTTTRTDRGQRQGLGFCRPVRFP